MVNKEMFTSGTDDWGTPKSLFDYLHDIHIFDLDSCASDYNYKMKPYFTEKENSLEQRWFGNVWCNPPYSKGLQEKFIRKAIEKINKGNCRKVVMLLPARTDTKNFHKLLVPNASVILFIEGRINFMKPDKSSDSAPFPSMIVVLEKREGTTKYGVLQGIPRKD